MGVIRRTLLAVIGLSVLNSRTLVRTTRTKVHFPNMYESSGRTLSSTDRLPSMDEFTLCLWVRFFGFINSSTHSTIFVGPNVRLELVKLSTDDIGIMLTSRYLGGDFCFPTGLTDLWWHHICVSVFYPFRKSFIYVNGRKCGKLSDNPPDLRLEAIELLKHAYVSRKRRLLLEITSLLWIGSTKFDNVSESWYGDMADVHVWDEILSDEQIKETAKCGSKRRVGNVFAWMRNRTRGYGVTLMDTQLCLP